MAGRVAADADAKAEAASGLDLETASTSTSDVSAPKDNHPMQVGRAARSAAFCYATFLWLTTKGLA